MTDIPPDSPAIMAPLLALDGYTPLPPGKLAAIVTFLEMRAPPAPLPERGAEGFTLRRVTRVDPQWYRALFRRIGEPWIWVSRLTLSDAELAAIFDDPAYELYVLSREGEPDLGLLELDYRSEGEAELAFFGVVPGLVGTGAGRFMMNRANALVWARPVSRFHVHTCTLDHPAAVGFYLKAGFRAVARAIEVIDDPRLSGLMPAGTAPNLPVIGA